MADVSAEDIAHLEELAVTLRRRLRFLETQCAAYGPLAIPAHIALEREDAERQLGQTLTELRRLRPYVFAERSPYLGLLTFQETNADLFFGRDTLIADLIERVRRAPFLAVLGASGSGKSSLVRAGLIPMLKGGAIAGSETWRYAILKPGARPLDTLAAELAKLQGDPTAVVKYGKTLASGERALLLLADALLDRGSGQRLVLVVDQFEELWTLLPSEPEQRTALLDQQHQPFNRLLLSAIAAPDTPLFVVLTMRADFLHRAAEEPALAHAIGQHDVIVSPMAPDELRAAIVRPAQLVGGDFEPGLIDELLQKVSGQPGALPLLEYTLAELWKQRVPDGTMTWAAYRGLGGVEGALAARADRLLAERYSSDQQSALRQVLLRLVQPGEGAADTRRRVRLDDLVPVGESHDSLYALLKPLIDERLLTSARDSASGEEMLEVSHEALIRAWPTLGRWVGEARADLRLQLQLEEAAEEWLANGKNPDLLWRGLRLSNAAAWLERGQPRLNARDQAFLAASRAAEQARAEAEEAARQRELEQAHALAAEQQKLADEQRLRAEEQQQRAEEQVATSRRLRQQAIFLAAALMVALIAAVTAAWFGFAAQQSAKTEREQKATAEHQAAVALARQLSSQASQDAVAQPNRALLFSVEANRLSDQWWAESSLLNALAINTRVLSLLRGHTDAVLAVAFSPNGTLLASGGLDNTIRLWNSATQKPLGVPLEGHSGAITSLVFSPDGTMLASGGNDKSIRLWDVATRQPLGTALEGHSAPIRSLVFGPNGKVLASGSADNTIRLWDVASGKPLGPVLEGHSASIRSLTFSPDGKRLASAADDATIRLWDLATGKSIAIPLQDQSAPVTSVAFSPDGKRLASAADDATIRLWDLATGKSVGIPLRGHTAPVTSLAFSPDGNYLASAADDRTVRLWDVRSGKSLGLPFRNHTAPVASVAFSPDGKVLASGSADNTIRLWDIATIQPLGTLLEGHTGDVSSVTFSPDGKVLASGSADNTIRLWDLASGKPLGVPLESNTAPATRVALNLDEPDRVSGGQGATIDSIAFSPNGSTLASGSSDSTIRLWDVVSGKPLGIPLQGHVGSVTSVAFSPDGKLLASGSADNTIRLWDVATRQPFGGPLKGHAAAISSIVFNRSGTILASSSWDHTIRLWDVASREPLGDPLMGHSKEVSSVAFSPDGTILASGSWDHTVRLWDVNSRQPLGDPLAEHTDDVTSVAFRPDGAILASGSWDGSIRLWDVATRQSLGAPLENRVALVKSDTFWVRSVAFSSDGKALAAGGSDKTIRLWDVDVESWISQACLLAGRNLTQDEWNQFISPDQPYHRTCPEFPPGKGA